jgi:hypothetical protein
MLHHAPFLMLVSYTGSITDQRFYQINKGKATEPVLQALGLRYAILDEPEQIALAPRLIGEPGYLVVSIETDQGALHDFPPENRPPMPMQQRARFLRAIGLER